MFSFSFYLELLFPALFNTNSHQLSGGITGGGSQNKCLKSLRRITERLQWRCSRCHRKKCDLVSCHGDRDIPASLQTPNEVYSSKGQIIHAVIALHKMSLSSHGPQTPQSNAGKLWLGSSRDVMKDIFTSLYSWIWLCSNMENTLEDPPSPCCCLLLAFLGAWEITGKNKDQSRT